MGKISLSKSIRRCGKNGHFSKKGQTGRDKCHAVRTGGKVVRS